MTSLRKVLFFCFLSYIATAEEGSCASGGEGCALSDFEYISIYRNQLRACKQELITFIDKINCNPIIVRLAWHDSGTYDRTIKQFPGRGGADGSIRFEKELAHGANAGLSKAVNYLRPFKDKYPEISWADLIQLASVTAIEHAGGPWIPIRFGRVDISTEDECSPEGNLPAANPPFPDGSADAAIHLRRVFYRMGFNDKEIVALSGGHSLGRAFAERSGTVNEGYGRSKATKFTNAEKNRPRNDGKEGLGMEGGRSWTRDWLTFDNQYFEYPQLNEQDQQQLLSLSTDAIVFVDPIFAQYAQLYAEDQNAFFEDYTRVHAKLSELGSKFYPKQGFYL